MERLLEQVRSLDAHPKTRDEFKVRTLQGGVSTVVAAVVALWLVRCELKWSWTPERRDRLYVNSSHGASVGVSFDVEFPRVSCELIGMDAMDQSGRPMGVKTEAVRKARLDPKTNRRTPWVGDFAATATTATHESHFTAANSSAAEKKCGDCYGASDEENPCCDTCDAVRKAYRQRGWTFRAQTVKQCQSETTARRMADQTESGCAVYGDVVLPSVSGNFHFAPGRHVADAAGHVSDLLALTFAQFNVSHVVKRLHFKSSDAVHTFSEYRQKTHGASDDDVGDDDDDAPAPQRGRRRATTRTKYQRRARRRRKRRRRQRRQRRLAKSSFDSVSSLRFSQLEGARRVVSDGYGMHQYYLKVVPTTYVTADGARVDAAQYSVTEHLRHVAPGSGRGLPGVFFFYEVSPVCAEVTEHRDGLPNFLVGLSAIVGGVYVTFGLLDRAVTFALERFFLDGGRRGRRRRSASGALLD